MSHVFISYAHDDMKSDDGILRRLVSRLRLNFNVWLDKSDIIPGTNWKDELQKAVRTSSVLVFFLSPRSSTSDWCEAELDAATSAKVPIIPYVYQKADFPFGLSSTNAIFADEAGRPQEKLEAAIRQLAPDTDINGLSALIENKLLHNRDITFEQAAADMKSELHFVVNVDNEDASGEATEIELIGLRLASTSFCTSYLVGRSNDNLAWKQRIQLGLQFSGEYRSSSFPVPIARHFFKKYGVDFPLRLLLIYGPPQITYDERLKTNTLSHVLDMPTDDTDQWADVLKAVQKTLSIYRDERDALELQIFVQGPVAGIMYELGSVHRGLHYQSEHYHFDRDSRRYHRVLGNLKG
jgi:hypothetical protein